MRQSAIIILVALLAAGCAKKADPHEHAQSDAQAIAQVEASRNVAPPVRPLAPEEITSGDIQKYKLLGAGCAFRADHRRGAVVVLAIGDKAYLKLDGELRVQAADSGGAKLPLGAWSRYQGREHVIDLQIAPGAGTPSGEETTDWRGRLTVRDPFDRVVYSEQGTVQCGP